MSVLCKSLLFLSVAGAVFCEHHKRDVHRIIIQERVPRSHQKQGHLGVERGRRPRGGRGSDSSSYEDGGSFSREGSFDEEVFHSVKTHKSPTKKYPAHRSPRHPSHPKTEETQRHSRRRKPSPQNDWVPLNQDQVVQHSQENVRVRDQRNKRKDAKSATKDKQKKHSAKTLKVLDLTTAYPLLHFEGSTLYPTLSWFPHLLGGDQTPMVSVMDHTRFDFANARTEDRLKNHKPDEESSLGSSSEEHEIIVGKNPGTHTRKRENRSRVTYFD